MAKRVKLKNDMYLDTKYSVHNDTILYTFLETLKQKIIYDSGNNVNGSWIRFEDGTMICYGTRSFTVSNSTGVGSLWYTGVIQMGKFPQQFISTPICPIFLIEGVLNPTERRQLSNTNIGYTYLYNGTKRTNQQIILGFLAIGSWKSGGG